MGSLTVSLAVVVTAVGLTPYESVTSDRVDLIELNHFYDEHGKHVFDQIIFYDWSAEDSRYHVRAWRLLKKPAQIPTRNWSRGDYITVWHDGEVLRRVRADATRESWTTSTRGSRFVSSQKRAADSSHWPGRATWRSCSPLICR